ncbi:MAG: lipid-A-disaccharide synthase [bacterium]
MPKPGGIIIEVPSSAVILMVAGEASGDLHGGNLAREILTRLPQARIFGIGGAKMQEAGVQLLRSIDDLAVVGISEVVLHWKAIRQTFHTLSQFIRERRPDLVILIDYPDFNLRLARVAKRERTRVLYYISPQVWAWRSWRVKTIARNVDTLLVVFPFEIPFYQGCGLDVRFIGHPLVDLLDAAGAEPRGREKVSFQLGVDPKGPIVGLLPGSRRSEIQRLLPQLLGAATRISRTMPSVQFLLALAPTIKPAEVEPYLRELDPSVKVLCQVDSTYDIIRLADLVLVSSGTATLETALLNTPMILVYRLSLISYILGRLLIRVPYIGLVNLVAEKRIVPELIQYQASPERIASLALNILRDSKRQESMRRELGKIKEKLGDPGSSARAAEVVVEMLGRGRK